MFCGKCGTEIPNEVVYCPKCGSKNNHSNVIDDKLSNNKTKLSRKKKGILVSGMLIVVLVVAAILISGKNDGNKEQTNGTGTHTAEQNKDASKDNSYQQEETLYCPMFKGQTIDSINQNAEYYTHFQFETIWEYNDEYDYSYVYEQSISEGTEITKGTQITLYVSEGKDVRYEEVAKQYATAIFMYDYGTVKQCLPYNPDALVDNTRWPEGWIEWEDTLAEMQQYYTVQADVHNSWEIDKDEIFQVISETNAVCSSYGKNIFDANNGIDVDNITKGYQVTVSIKPFEIEENERYPSAEVTYTVVMHNGEWKILSDFILEQQRQDEAGRW